MEDVRLKWKICGVREGGVDGYHQYTLCKMCTMKIAKNWLCGRNLCLSSASKESQMSENAGKKSPLFCLVINGGNGTVKRYREVLAKSEHSPNVGRETRVLPNIEKKLGKVHRGRL